MSAAPGLTEPLGPSAARLCHDSGADAEASRHGSGRGAAKGEVLFAVASTRVILAAGLAREDA
jgi:hypothetical protein